MTWNCRRPDLATLRRLVLDERLPDYTIAEMYSAAPKTVARWRQRFGLPSNTPAPKPVQKQDGNRSRAYVKRDGSSRGAKQRKCLGCGTMFASEWVGNRQCHRCKATTAGHGMTSVADVRLRR